MGTEGLNITLILTTYQSIEFLKKKKKNQSFLLCLLFFFSFFFLPVCNSTVVEGFGPIPIVIGQLRRHHYNSSSAICIDLINVVVVVQSSERSMAMCGSRKSLSVIWWNLPRCSGLQLLLIDHLISAIVGTEILKTLYIEVIDVMFMSKFSKNF